MTSEDIILDGTVYFVELASNPTVVTATIVASTFHAALAIGVYHPEYARTLFEGTSEDKQNMVKKFAYQFVKEYSIGDMKNNV